MRDVDYVPLKPITEYTKEEYERYLKGRRDITLDNLDDPLNIPEDDERFGIYINIAQVTLATPEGNQFFLWLHHNDLLDSVKKDSFMSNRVEESCRFIIYNNYNTNDLYHTLDKNELHHLLQDIIKPIMIHHSDDIEVCFKYDDRLFRRLADTNAHRRYQSRTRRDYHA